MTRHHTQPEQTSLAGALRALPSVDALAQTVQLRLESSTSRMPSAARLTQVARDVLAQARSALRRGDPVATDLETLASQGIARLSADTIPAPTPVINGTGVIINTNLGRATLSHAAIEAVAAVASGYSALEFDLDHGTRGSRQQPVRALLRDLLGAEDALVVNNNAAAMLVVLSALATQCEVIISRGELVEIGGGFRIPDVLRQSGAHLIEVGTTNRTRPDDFASAITAETALLLSVHPSNYRIVGFTATPPLAELARIAHEHGLPLVHDLGSGALLRTERWGLAHEPMPMESLAAGADLICISGDKLLGGPQAGILAGKAELIARIEHHPLMRAIRIDKMTLAALVATLRSYRDGAAETEIPVWRMIASPVESLKVRADSWASELRGHKVNAQVVRGNSTVGGGSLPGETLPTWHCAILPPDTENGVTDTSGDAASALATRLRIGKPPVVARVLRDRVLLDPRTVLPEQDATLIHALRNAYSG